MLALDITIPYSWKVQVNLKGVQETQLVQNKTAKFLAGVFSHGLVKLFFLKKKTFALAPCGFTDMLWDIDYHLPGSMLDLIPP